jgi:hypothetical protein
VDYVRNAGREYFDEDILAIKCLDRLLEVVDKFVPRRNDIAHGAVTHHGESTASLFAPPASKSYKKPFKLDAEHVVEFARYFDELSMEIADTTTLLWSLPDRTLHETNLSPELEPHKWNLHKARFPAE